MRVMFDTNVVLDLLLDRAPFADDAETLFGFVEEGRLQGYLCATTLTTLHYLAAKVVGSAKAREQLQTLLALFEIAPVTRSVLEEALADDCRDFEDAVLCRAAIHVGTERIVTRNPADFRTCTLLIVSPRELVSGLRAG